MSYKPQTPKDPLGVFCTLVLGRISTPQQDENNIQASYDYVRPIISQIYGGPIEVKELGEQGSGMLTDRATILEAYAELETGKWDLMLMEDISKAYRNPRWQAAIVQDAVDLNTRVICPGDGLDTFEENWEVLLATAMVRHGLHIPDTRRRVRRTADYAFRHGGMVQRVRFGYRKLSKEEAASGEFGPKGLRIAKLPECTPTIREIRRRLMETHRPMEVVTWLNEEGIKPGPYVKNGRWTVGVLRDEMCDPLLGGTRTFRKIRYNPIFKTGKHKREVNPEPLSEVCPGLAHLTREEQDSLLAAMGWSYHQRSPKPKRNGLRRGVPRDHSFWPGQAATCAICNERMHLMGKHLKCRNAHGRRGVTCWNHVQVPVETTRTQVLGWLADVVGDTPAIQAAFVDWFWAVLKKANEGSGRFADAVQRHIEVLAEQEKRLAKAILLGGDIPALVAEAAKIRTKIKKAERALAKGQGASRGLARFETRDHVAENLREALMIAAATSYEVGKALRKIITQLMIQPVQALDSGLVRPRAKVKVCLTGVVNGNNGDQAEIMEFEAVFDLFNPPDHISVIPRYLATGAAARANGGEPSLEHMGQVLGVNRMTIKRARDYIKLMASEGTTEAYRELSERPEHGSRWKPRAKNG